MSNHGFPAAGVFCLAFGAGAINCAAAADSPAPGTAMLSGIDLQYVDHSVRPQDDEYRHLTAKWLDGFQIPPDKGSYGSFTCLDDLTQEQLRGIIDGLAGNADAEARKIG